jgi:hypothetical protein
MSITDSDFRLCPDYRTRPRDCGGVRAQKLADGTVYVCTFCPDTKFPTPPKEQPDAPKP